MPAPLLRTLFPPRIQDTLEALYTDTLKTDPAIRKATLERGVEGEGHPDFHHAMREAYMPVTPEFGALLYIVARTARARSIVEFGASFGISAIFLAAALRDNGGGKLITTECEPFKAERAMMNLAAAGLDDLVEIRTGDARQSLAKDIPAAIDLIFLDGAKALYLDVLKLLELRLVVGGSVASDNSGMVGATAYLDYVRDPVNGYTSASILTSALGSYHGHEIVVRR
jgi:predicted O-methyltransferase YrrM